MNLSLNEERCVSVIMTTATANRYGKESVSTYLFIDLYLDEDVDVLVAELLRARGLSL